MAVVTSNAIPDLITSGSTAESELDAPIRDDVVIKVTVVSGTFKFNAVGDAADSNLSLAAGESVTLTLPPGRNLHFIATGASDTFKIEG